MRLYSLSRHAGVPLRGSATRRPAYDGAPAQTAAAPPAPERTSSTQIVTETARKSGKGFRTGGINMNYLQTRFTLTAASLTSVQILDNENIAAKKQRWLQGDGSPGGLVGSGGPEDYKNKSWPRNTGVVWWGRRPGVYRPPAMILTYCRALCAASLWALPQEMPVPWHTVTGEVESSARHWYCPFTVSSSMSK